MKTRTLATLLFSAVLAVPAFAQQTSSSAQPATPAAAPATTEREPIPNPAPRDFWDGDEPGVASLLMHPFATKQYVKRHVAPIKDRINELDEITTYNTQTIRDIDARAQHGLKLASEKTDLADAHAIDANNKAQLAQQSATALSARVNAVETKVGNIDQYKSGAQTEIRFRPGQTVLSKDAKDALDQMAAQLKSERGYILEVQGFSSGRGQTAIANSRKMADSVVRYLVLNHEVPAYRIFVLGMGNVSADKHATGTRVEVSLLKNDLDQTAKQ